MFDRLGAWSLARDGLELEAYRIGDESATGCTRARGVLPAVEDCRKGELTFMLAAAGPWGSLPLTGEDR